MRSPPRPPSPSPVTTLKCARITGNRMLSVWWVASALAASILSTVALKISTTRLKWMRVQSTIWTMRCLAQSMATYQEARQASNNSLWEPKNPAKVKNMMITRVTVDRPQTSHPTRKTLEIDSPKSRWIPERAFSRRIHWQGALQAPIKWAIRFMRIWMRVATLSSWSVGTSQTTWWSKCSNFNEKMWHRRERKGDLIAFLLLVCWEKKCYKKY